MLPEWAHRRLRLTPAARELLELCVRLGYLASAEEFLASLQPPIEPLVEEPLTLDRPELRRLLAAWLLERRDQLPPDTAELLAREWSFLFG